MCSVDFVMKGRDEVVAPCQSELWLLIRIKIVFLCRVVCALLLIIIIIMLFNVGAASCSPRSVSRA